MDFYIVIHSVFTAWPSYFTVYSILRIIKHWNDGKERVQTSSGRLIVKIAATVACAVIQIIHIVDFFPKKYSESKLISRSVYFCISMISWVFSAILVYFDYSRRLKSQWRGQRLYWIMELINNIILLSFNLYSGLYLLKGSELYQFDIIQILAYCLSILICLLLTFYSIFLPNDFTVITANVYLKLKRSSILFDGTGNESTDEQINIKASISGYKIKQVSASSIVHYKITVALNALKYTVSRSLFDFEELDKTLREKFPKSLYPNLNFPSFHVEHLRKLSPDERGIELNKYMVGVVCQDFMTPDLLNFLQIEGNYRDILMLQHSQMAEERYNIRETPQRATSSTFNYYTQAIATGEFDKSANSQVYQWMIHISFPSYRNDEHTGETDYYLRTSIEPLGFEKIKPFKFKDFCDFHKNLKKSISPAVPIKFPSMNYTKSLKKNDKEAIEYRKAQLEYYFSQILNDPAYLTKESLEFIGCDADVNQVLNQAYMPTYKLCHEITWENDISDDSSTFIVYSMGISKLTRNSVFEMEWRINKRFREFDGLHEKLQMRHSSPLLKNYLLYYGKIPKDTNVPNLPNLPSKYWTPLSTLAEIEERKKNLEGYMKELLSNPAVTCSYAFREFIGDKD
ncbi:hypothetical protein SteCoe_22502 [Stentor coeruleus]|uniref:PX domain-containing protein n=1 Tax=Stentor coeruleus TaxID=5963 RepID=A0A1R2BM80_9CILI|nr:hypothetical protein SteCoe_22502 [Stentor coeruleus]